MPIYEYRCESCAEKFEVLTRFAERDKAQACPTCESTRPRVLVSSFASLTGESSASDFMSESSGGGCGCGGACSCGSSPN
jgi:putative FmdB family regulatory protein